jgi:hypothetical protein
MIIEKTPHQRTVMRHCTIPILTASSAFVALIACNGAALAQGKLEAHYGMTFARVSVGEIDATLELKASEYSIGVNGKARGLIKALISGEGELSARGLVEEGAPVPTDYSSKLKSEGGTATVSMVLDHGQVTQLTVTPVDANWGDGIKEKMEGVTDPLTALLMPVAAGQDGLSADACQRTAAVFDGHHRYDLKFAFKRLEKEADPKKTYSGPILVCSLAYQPIGPDQPSPLGKYVSEGRDMEIAFVALAGTRVLAPVRFSVASMIANMVIEADRFAWKADSGQ